MKTNRIPATYNVNYLGESRTPRLSNIEKARRSREVEHRANRRARRQSHAQREARNNRPNFWCIALIMVILLLVAIGFQVKAHDARISAIMTEQQAYEESTVLLSNGERVDREDYERANEEARQAELEQLGLEG